MSNISVLAGEHALQLPAAATTSGEDGVAAYGVLMYVQFIFVAIFIGYSIGSAPVIGYHYGAGNRDELQNLLRKSVAADRRRPASLLTLLARAAGRRRWPRIFVGYDADAARADRARLPPVRLLVPARGLQHLHLGASSPRSTTAVSRRRSPSCARWFSRRCCVLRPACAVRHRRHLVGHHGGGGVRVCDFAHLPADQAEEIRLYVTPVSQNRILPFTGTRRAARPLCPPRRCRKSAHPDGPPHTLTMTRNAPAAIRRRRFAVTDFSLGRQSL